MTATCRLAILALGLGVRGAILVAAALNGALGVAFRPNWRARSWGPSSIRS